MTGAPEGSPKVVLCGFMFFCFFLFFCFFFMEKPGIDIIWAFLLSVFGTCF